MELSTLDTEEGNLDLLEHSWNSRFHYEPLKVFTFLRQRQNKWSCEHEIRDSVEHSSGWWDSGGTTLLQVWHDPSTVHPRNQLLGLTLGSVVGNICGRNTHFCGGRPDGSTGEKSDFGVFTILSLFGRKDPRQV